MDKLSLDDRIAEMKASPEGTIRKQFTISPERAVDDVARTAKFTITNGEVDRDDDVIDPRGWDTRSFMRSPTICWAHDYAALPIARALDVTIVGDELQSTAQFPPKGVHPFADTVFELIKGGFLNACSVGFKPLEFVRDEKRGGINFVRQSLLEWSICGIPSNPNALIVARSKGINVEPLREWAEGVLKGLAVQKVPPQAKVKTDGIADTCPACGAALVNQVCPGCGWRSPNAPELSEAMRVQASLDDPIRWNRTLSKSFDVDGEPLEPSKLEYTWVSRFLNVPVKDLYETTLNIISPRMGSYLSALEESLAPFKTETVRRLTYGGKEEPPVYETVQLNSKLSRSFLMDGIRFLTGPNKMVAKITPSWSGLSLTIFGPSVASEKVREFLNGIGTRAVQYRFMKGEAFALSGEFLDRGAETWSDLFLAPVDLDPIKRTVALVNEHGAAMESRGIIMAGRPGCGKTMAARVMMNEAKDATYIWVSSRDFYRSGAAGGISLAFDLAAENAPSILCVEDIDSWLDNSAIDLLKTELDGLKQRKGIVTVLTTNFPEQLPEALLDRPGRFHDVLIMSLPSESIRRAMLAKWAPDAKTSTLDTLAKDTQAFSGAHLRELVRLADTIRAQDGTGIDASLNQALDKVRAQRTLIDETRRGPKLRSVKAFGGPMKTWVDYLRSETGLDSASPHEPFVKDAVGFNAFLKARDRAQRKAGTEPLADLVLADVLGDYGFDDEAQSLRTKANASAPSVTKGVSPKDVSLTKAPEDEAWSKPSLSDLTDKSWGDLSDGEKRKIAGRFAYATAMPPVAFGDLSLPHHNAKGDVVWLGVAAATARLDQTNIPSADLGSVKAHLRRHHKAFGKDIPDVLKASTSAIQKMEDEAGEEAAELVSYQTLATMLDSVSGLLAQSHALVNGMIADETETPTETTQDEDAEEALEEARLESLQALATQMIGGLEGVNRLSGDLLEDEDEDQIALPMYPGMTMAIHEPAVIAKRGRVISASNEAKLKMAKDHAHQVVGHLDTVLSQIAMTTDEEHGAAATAGATDVVFDLDADDIRVLKIDKDDLDVSTADMTAALTAAIRDTLRTLVQDQTQATLNHLRGRVD